MNKSWGNQAMNMEEKRKGKISSEKIERQQINEVVEINKMLD